MKIKTVLLDDEPLALRLLEDFAKKVPFLSVQAAFTNPAEALLFIRENPVDLIFLDINMPDISGLNLLQQINTDILAVFCTAYPDFALKGFELQAVDYLVKPFPFDRFLKAACNAQEQFMLRKNYEEQSAKKGTEDDFIFIKSEYSLVKINTNEILFAEGLKDYIKIFTTSETKPILTLQSLRSLEEKLSPELFCRVHKSFIVNLAKIKSVQRNFIYIGEREIPVGNQYKDQFQSLLEKRMPK